MKTTTISSGQTSSGIVLSGGDAEYVLSGGRAVGTVVQSGAVAVVYDGGLVSGTLDAGVEIVSAGGLAQATVVRSGGMQLVSAAGDAVSASVDAGGEQYLAGGSARATVVSAGGYLVVDSGGAASGSIVQSGGTLVVLPGGSAAGTQLGTGGRALSGGVVILSGDAVLVAQSGVVSGERVGAAATEYVLSGGRGVAAVVSGGEQLVASGGVASGTVVRAGAELVLSGGLASGTVASGGAVTVMSGGVAAGIVLRGGSLFVLSDGFARQAVVSAGGSAFVFSGGIAFSASIAAGGVQVIEGGGAARASLVQSGGLEVVGAGGSAQVTQLRSGGEQYVSGGSVAGTVVQAGAALLVASGQGVTGADVQSGGMLVVLPGGAAAATVVEPGGSALSGGVFLLSGVRLVSAVGTSLSGAAIGAGQTEYVLSRGVAVSATVAGVQYVYSAGVASAALIGSGGLAQVLSAGVARGAVVSAGGVLEVAFAGSAGSTTVLSGGQSEVVGGLVVGTQLASGAQQAVFGGTASATLVQAGATELVEGGAASGSIVHSGGEQYLQQGKVVDTVLDAGGYLVVSAGVASFTQVGSGGTLVLLPGAAASATVVASGGVVLSTGVVVLSAHQLVSAASLVQGGTLQGGFSEFVLDSGVVSAQAVDGLLTVGSGGVASGGSIASFAQVLSGGTLRGVEVAGIAVLASGALTSGDRIDAGGQEQLLAGGVENAAFIGSGARVLVAGGGVAAYDTVAAGGVLDVQQGGLAGFTHLLEGGAILLEEFGFVSSGTASFDSGTDTLVVSAAGISETLLMAGDYAGEHFVASGGFGLTIGVTDAPCYCRGTQVLTDRGEVAVEDLAIGDALVTLSGAARRLRWIGRRSYAARFAAGNATLLPVRFAAGALGCNVPRRPLYVSPLHAMYLDDVLIPAACLVNGTTVTQPETEADVAYYHLELDSHDVILAEGAAAETYLDDGNRLRFHNAAEYFARYPAARAAKPVYCAPRVEDGPVLEAVRRRLGGAAVVPDGGPLRGWLDDVGRGRIAGWAMDDGPGLLLRILDNGVTLGQITTDLFRADVRAAHGGDGMCGFEFVVDGGLDASIRHVIRVERVGDGTALGNAPWVLEPGQATGGAGVELRGNVDHADRDRLVGWAAGGDGPVGLQVLVDGVLFGTTLANRFRGDLAAGGVGDGRQGFVFRFPGGLAPGLRHHIAVLRESDGAALPGGALVLEAADGFDRALQHSIARAVDGAAGADRGRVLSFMMAQAEKLVRLAAAAEGQHNEREDWERFARRMGTDATPRIDPGLRALVVDALPPRPDQDAGSQALVSHMRALQALGYQVSFAAADRMQRCPALEAIGITSCATPYYASVEDVLRLQADCFDLVYVHRASVAQAYLPLARRWQNTALLVYGLGDLHHLRLARAAVVEQRPELMGQSNRVRLAECTAALSADLVLTHSPVEAAVLARLVPQALVAVVPWDVAPRPVQAPFAERSGLVFVGHYGHAPNVDAARFLAEAVMPLVWAADPQIECRLVGSAMPLAVRRLARPGITVVGHVPGLEGVFGVARLCVAPLRYGAGIKGKVLDSLAAGLPCVMTEIAAEGLDLPPGLAELTAGDAAGLAALILRLHADPVFNRDAAAAGLAYVRERNAPETVSRLLAAGIERAETPVVVRSGGVAGSVERGR